MNTVSPRDPSNNSEPIITPTQTNMLPDDLTWWSDWSDRLGILTAVVGGFAAIFGMIGFGFSLKAGKLKDAELDRYKKESEAAIATANARSEEAKEGAGKANERAAALSKDAETARLAHEQLKEKLAWRTISADARLSLIKSLRADGGKVSLHFVAGDPESTMFALQFSEVFKAAGWDVRVTGNSYTGILWGMWIPAPVPNTDATKMVWAGLESIGIDFRRDTPKIQPFHQMGDEAGDWIDNNPKDGRVLILVGCKNPI
jgi:hypothetical protein